MKSLYHYHWYLGRMGSVQGTFLATPESVQKLIGKHVYFGEILGKHSEVSGTIQESHLTKLGASAGFVEEFGRLFPNGFGYNPFSYVQDDDPDSEDDAADEVCLACDGYGLAHSSTCKFF